MAGLLRNRQPERLEQVATGSDGRIAYASPVNPPATSYAGTSSPLHSVSAKEYQYADPRNAAIVNRHFRKDGIESHYNYGGRPEEVRFIADPPRSSRFQQTLVRLWPWSINTKWYIAYPAATVMNGGARNQGLSERTPQITTRTSGGPGAFLMGVRPQFTKVLQVPRAPTAPQSVKPQSTAG